MKHLWEEDVLIGAEVAVLEVLLQPVSIPGGSLQRAKGSRTAFTQNSGENSEARTNRKPETVEARAER
jgi:hypothetical protein